jgi:hypothetical protein
MPGITFAQCRSLLELQDMKRMNHRGRNTDTSLFTSTGTLAKGPGKGKKKKKTVATEASKEAAPPTAPPAAPPARASASLTWLSLQHPWNGAIQMWPYGQGGRFSSAARSSTAQRTRTCRATPPHRMPSPRRGPTTCCPSPTTTSMHPRRRTMDSVPPPPSLAPSTTSWNQDTLMNQFQTMGFQAPTREWVMDTSASSHFTSDPGTLTSVSPPSISSRAVVVGNGSSLPITGTGHRRFPLSTSSRPLYLLTSVMF